MWWWWYSTVYAFVVLFVIPMMNKACVCVSYPVQWPIRGLHYSTELQSITCSLKMYSHTPAAFLCCSLTKTHTHVTEALKTLYHLCSQFPGQIQTLAQLPFLEFHNWRSVANLPLNSNHPPIAPSAGRQPPHKASFCRRYDTRCWPTGLIPNIVIVRHYYLAHMLTNTLKL